MPINATAGAPTSISPDNLYSLAEFIRVSGLSYSRIRQAAHDGLEIPTIAVGKRKWVDGAAGISYVHELAELHRKQQDRREQDNRNNTAPASSEKVSDGQSRHQSL
jgi:hypothetical protein